jgi:hypothetical protein
MNLAAVECPRCRTSLDWTTFNRSGFIPCARCDTPIEVEVFPALFRPPAPVQDAQVVLDGESTCFYHSDTKAELPCEACGRFLCALCDCELKAQHFCPRCLETGKEKGKIRNLNNTRTKYDSIALSLAIVPIFFLYPTLITAPLSLFVTYRHWNSPLGIARRTKVRFIIAVFFALLQIAGWALLFLVLIQYLYG